MQEDDLKYVVRMLQDANCSAVSRNVSLSYLTVRRIANGSNKTPQYDTVKRLADYFRAK